MRRSSRISSRGSILVLAASALVACDADAPRCEPAEPLPPAAREGDSPFGLLRCERVPELCDRQVASEVRTGDLAVAIDVVFLPDGFGDDLDAFHERVDDLVEGARTDPRGILRRDPDLFNVHRVELTASLGACVTENLVDESDTLAVDEDRVLRAAANAPDADVIVVVSRDLEGRANVSATTGVPIVRLGTFGDRTLTHELGHALFGLGDEYVDVDETHPYAGRPRSLGRIRPNVSLDATETWGGEVAGAHEGAMQYGRGVFRPTDDCRMGESESDRGFCPVCSAHIDAGIAARRGADVLPPLCAVLFAPADDIGRACAAGEPGCGADGRALLHVVAWDAGELATVDVTTGELSIPLQVCAPGQTCSPVLFEGEVDTRVPPGSAIEVRCTDRAGNASRSTLQL